MTDFNLARPTGERLHQEDPHFVGEVTIYGMALSLGLLVSNKDRSARILVSLADPDRMPHRRWDEEVSGVIELRQDGMELWGTWRLGHELFDVAIRAVSVETLTGEEQDKRLWTYLQGRIFRQN